MELGKPPVQVAKYGPGDYFGERALLKNEPRAANIIATSQL
jgi:CRP-like cAMP-binding protein